MALRVRSPFSTDLVGLRRRTVHRSSRSGSSSGPPAAVRLHRTGVEQRRVRRAPPEHVAHIDAGVGERRWVLAPSWKGRHRQCGASLSRESWGSFPPAMSSCRCDHHRHEGFRRCAYCLVSGGGRDKSFESFGWSLPPKGQAWAFVEEPGDVVELVLGVDR